MILAAGMGAGHLYIRCVFYGDASRDFLPVIMHRIAEQHPDFTIWPM